MAVFKNEYEYLVHLVKCAINNQSPIEIPSELSFRKVYEIGKTHEVGNIAFISVLKLENKPDAELLKEWKTFYAFSVTRNANQFEVRKKAVEAFKSLGVRSLEVQGSVMKEYYENPEWRMMTDIDFIVDKDNLPKIKEYFEQMGYCPTYAVGDDLEPVEIGTYGPYNTLIEVHSEFFENSEYEGYGSIINPFETAIPTGEGLCHRADDTTFYLYNVLHCIKHYLGKGCGIRRILDIYVLNEKLKSKIDTERVKTVFENAGYTELVFDLFSLAYKWFGDRKTHRDLSEMEKIVFMSGNHGNSVVKLKQQYKKQSKNGQKAFRIKKFLSRIFLSKKEIYSTYPFCKKHNLPIVIAQLYRWGCLIFVKERRERAARTISTIKDTKLN